MRVWGRRLSLLDGAGGRMPQELLVGRDASLNARHGRPRQAGPATPEGRNPAEFFAAAMAKSWLEAAQVPMAPPIMG